MYENGGVFLGFHSSVPVVGVILGLPKAYLCLAHNVADQKMKVRSDESRPPEKGIIFRLP